VVRIRHSAARGRMTDVFLFLKKSQEKIVGNENKIVILRYLNHKASPEDTIKGCCTVISGPGRGLLLLFVLFY
jgi:hypothetical protein